MNRIAGIFNKLQLVAASKKFRLFVLILFVAQAGFLVFATNLRTPPDEGNHIDFIEYYADHSKSPILHSQTPTVNLGDKTREVDYVYHFSMSWLMRISPFSQHIDLYIIRLLGVAFALLSFIILLKVFRDVGVGKAASNLALLAVTNLPMVLMMSAAINNDVFVWLGLIAGVYYLMRIIKQPRPVDILMLLTISIYGGLVKRTLFPICLAFGIAGLVMTIKYWQILKPKITVHSWKQIMLAVLILIGTGLFVERVGGNIYRYHSITPSCVQVQGEKPCSVFWLQVRKSWINDDSSQSTSGWLAGGASKDTTLMSLPQFAIKWSDVSFNNIVDIQTNGWQHKVVPPWWLGSLLLILAAITIVGGSIYDARRWRKDTQARWRLVMVGLAAIVVVSEFVVNLSTYHDTHVFGIALNGRYILPAVILLAGLNFWYGRKLFGRIPAGVMAVAVPILIIAGSGIIMMVRNPQLFG